MAKDFYVCQVAVATVDGVPRVAWLPEPELVAANDAEEALRICAADGDMGPGTVVVIEQANVTSASMMPSRPLIEPVLDSPPVLPVTP